MNSGSRSSEFKSKNIITFATQIKKFHFIGVSNHSILNNQSTSPPKVPRAAGLRNVTKFIQNPIPYLIHFSEKYGSTYYFYLGGLVKSVMTIDPELSLLTLQKNHRNYEKSYFQTELLAKYIGKGLLTASGPYWLQQRRLIQPGFHKDRLKQVTNLMQEEIDQYIHELKSAQEKKIELYDTMSQLAFRIVSKTLFSTDTKAHGLEELKTIVIELQNYFIRRERQPYYRWLFYLMGREKQAMKRAAQAQKILLSYINERRDSGEYKDDLLDMLLATRYEDGSQMTDKQLIDETIILFVAGHETTANALTWILYTLYQHPDIIARIKTEASFETDDIFEYLKQLTYTEQVIKEGMRLYPPVWIIDRVTKTEENYKGWVFPENTMILSLIYGMHRDPKVWDQPDVFNPDRFSLENEKNIPNGSYMPFGAGPRYCIGQSFAMMEMKLAIAAWVKHMDIKITTTGVGMRPLISLKTDRPVEVLIQ